MREQRDRVWDILWEIAQEIAERDNLSENQLMDTGKLVFNHMIECLMGDLLSPKANVVFMTALKLCNLTRKDIAQFINENNPKVKNKLTSNNVRDLLHDARTQVKNLLVEKLDLNNDLQKR